MVNYYALRYIEITIGLFLPLCLFMYKVEKQKCGHNTDKIKIVIGGLMLALLWPISVVLLVQELLR